MLLLYISKEGGVMGNFPLTRFDKAFSRFKYCKECKKPVVAMEDARQYNKKFMVRVICPHCFRVIGIRPLTKWDIWMARYWM